MQYEDLHLEGNDVQFVSAPSVGTEVNQSLVPKVGTIKFYQALLTSEQLNSIGHCLHLSLFCTNIGCELW